MGIVGARIINCDDGKGDGSSLTLPLWLLSLSQSKALKFYEWPVHHVLGVYHRKRNTRGVRGYSIEMIFEVIMLQKLGVLVGMR